jgi:hypothetical protein
VGTETGINNSKENYEVVEHLRREGCVGDTQLQTGALRSSVKLCQVGIDPVQGVHKGIIMQRVH